MHDPRTVAFDIRRPWPSRDQWSKIRRWYWPNLITIWHRDPEADGSDNSCGWPFPRITEADEKLVADMVEWDLKFPFYSSPSLADLGVVLDPAYSFRSLPPGQAFGFIAAAWAEVGARKRKTHRLTSHEGINILDSVSPG